MRTLLLLRIGCIVPISQSGWLSMLVMLMLLPPDLLCAQELEQQFDTAITSEVEQLRIELSDLRQQFEIQNVSPSDLIAPPIDPQQIIRTGEFRGAFLIPGTDVSLRIGGYARADGFYDTGYVTTGVQLFPSGVALDDSLLAGRSGTTTITGSQSRLNFDAQAKTEIGRIRGFVELDFLQNDVNPRLRHAFGEWRSCDTVLLAGHTWSTFMDLSSLPFVIPETTAAGAIFRRHGMFRIEHQWNDITSFAVALEAPRDSDYTLPTATDQPFGRYPDLIARIRFSEKDTGSLQIASLVRGIGFENAQGRETERVAWGLAVTGRIQLGERDNLRLGVTGGEGIGSYIGGLGTDLAAAGPDTNGYRTLDAIGAYGAFQHFWSENWFSNIYYGFSNVASTPLMPTTAGDETQNAGINLVWSPRRTFGIGVEYAYATRVVRNGTSGDNHRVQFTVQFGP